LTPENNMLKKYLHNPAHLFIDNSPYFITSAIYQKRNLLASHAIKENLIETIQDSFAKKNWLLKDWVILDNHYHVMTISDKGADLSKIINKIHTLSSQFICSELNAEKPIWWNYWDYCPRNERDYYIRLNYLYNNPIKHGLVTNLLDYPYSSFHLSLKQYGRKYLIKQFREYPEYKNLQLDED
jgi:putative transposase